MAQPYRPRFGGDLGAQQISAGRQKTAGVKSKAAAYLQLHDDLLAISDAAHSLVRLGTAGLDGKFHLPRNHGEQDILNAARAFKQPRGTPHARPARKTGSGSGAVKMIAERQSCKWCFGPPSSWPSPPGRRNGNGALVVLRKAVRQIQSLVL